jgi:ElaB/YqjD/DUF883 family membrane-anchored ribosome-binding protein
MKREDLVARLQEHGVHGDMQALQGILQSKLADEISSAISHLADVISQASDHLARGAQSVGTELDALREETMRGTEAARMSLDKFRDSMDKSSRTMSRLTLWLVILTAVSAASTAAQVLRICWPK